MDTVFLYVRILFAGEGQDPPLRREIFTPLRGEPGVLRGKGRICIIFHFWVIFNLLKFSLCAILNILRAVFFCGNSRRNEGCCRMSIILLASLAITVAAESALFQILGRKFGSKLWETVLTILVINIFGVICAKATGVIEKGSMEGFSMIRMTGAILSMPLFFWLACKVRKWPVPEAFDVLTIVFVIGYAMMRVSCFLHGCCQGIEIPGLGLRVPLRELEIILFAVFMVVQFPKFKAGTCGGKLYPLLMIWYGVFRFIAEWFRVEYFQAFWIFHWAHIWSVIMIVAGISVYGELEAARQRKNQAKRRRNLRD